MKRQHVRAFFPSILLLALATAAYPDAVDEIVLSRMKERNIPGAAVAVVKQGKVLKLKGYGLASLEFGVPVTTETVFEIGSVSKQITAAGIMLLVEDGKVDLDEKISKYLPDTPESWKDITVRHLLTHTSGIKSYTSLTGFELARRVTIEGFIKQLAPYPLEFTPGDKSAYSNSGYNLLAYIIQTQSGQTYIDFLRGRIFRPLGMSKTTDRDPQFIVPLRANGYEWSGDHYSGRDASLTDLMGAGSIVSTVGDMVKWNAALSGNRFLKPESKAAIWTQFTFNNGEKSVYGFGWRISEIRGHKLIGHTGQTAGFGAANFRYPASDVTITVLTNQGGSGTGSLIAARLAKFYIPSMSLKSMKVSPDAVPLLGGKILDVLRSRREGKFDPDLLSSDLIKSLATEESNREYLRIASFGKPKSAVMVDKSVEGPKTSYSYRVESQRRIFLWRVVLDGEGKIAELSLVEEE